jgi:ankyrin repeat protein
MAAASRGHVAVAKALLAKGADARAITAENKTALNFAQAAGHRDVVAVLRGSTRGAETR